MTVPKTAVSIFGKGRMMVYFIFRAQPAESEIRQVQMGFFAHSPFGESIDGRPISL
jgi:hypothetical protein